jgi:hypothetical protein
MTRQTLIPALGMVATLGATALVTSCAIHSAQPIRPADVPKGRLEIIRRAEVWTPVSVRARDIRLGPQLPGAFKPGQTVACDYVAERPDGGTPKFTCAIAGTDRVKVKYGEDNGEVFGEVAASRLLWALGFPADAQYPVRVACRGCSEDPWTDRATKRQTTVFPLAAIERKYPGTEIEPGNRTGWAWPELDLVDEAAGGAPRAHRDALKLAAVFMQHTDSKPQQQRVLCTDRTPPAKESSCSRPIMMINDVGLTFGKANNLNKNARGSTNLVAWQQVPVWRDPARCVGELSKSITGTLEHPAISEAGRKFLADLLSQLTDAQLRDLFETARLSRRLVDVDGVEQAASTAAWVRAFKAKRDQIVKHTCPA